MSSDVPKDEISKIAQFIPARDIRDHFFVGYDRQMRAGLAIGKCASQKGVWRILLFGFPGCGKSEYPFALASRLRSDLDANFSLLYVKCHRLASTLEDAGKMRAYLRDLTEKIQRFQPIILAFDEFDAISPRRTSLTSSLTELSLWAMSFLTNGTDVDSEKKIIFFGITNFPNQIDIAVRDRLQYPMHFDTAEREVISGILTHNGIANSDEVAGRLVEVLARVGQTVTGRGIALACKALKRLDGAAFPECLRGKTADEVATLLSVHAQPVNGKEISDYNAQNWALVNQSANVVDFWLTKYDDTIRRPTTP